MNMEHAAGWVTVAAFLGIDGDLQADLLVMNLQGWGVPAIRRPILPTTCLPMAHWPMIREAFVLVPGSFQEDAAEIIGEQPRRSTRPQVRSLFRWAIAWMLVSGFLGGVPYRGSARAGGLAELANRLFATAVVFVGIMLARALVALFAVLLGEGRLRWDARPLVVGLLFFGALALLMAPLVCAPTREAFAAGYALLGVVLWVWLRLRRRRA